MVREAGKREVGGVLVLGLSYIRDGCCRSRPRRGYSEVMLAGAKMVLTGNWAVWTFYDGYIMTGMLEYMRRHRTRTYG